MTTARWAVLRFVAGYHAKHRLAPTVREIATGLGRSPSTVHAHLAALKESGHLLRGENRARATLIVPMAGSVAEEIAELALSFELASAHEREFVPDGVEATEEISRALRAAAFEGYALGLRRAGELVAGAPASGEFECEGD